MEDRRCIICGKEEGKGLFIYESFVCQTCEREMVHTNVEDDKYRFFIQKLKKIWLKQNA
jgi:hypothetical protein